MPSACTLALISILSRGLSWFDILRGRLVSSATTDRSSTKYRRIWPFQAMNLAFYFVHASPNRYTQNLQKQASNSMFRPIFAPPHASHRLGGSGEKETPVPFVNET